MCFCDVNTVRTLGKLRGRERKHIDRTRGKECEKKNNKNVDSIHWNVFEMNTLSRLVDLWAFGIQTRATHIHTGRHTQNDCERSMITWAHPYKDNIYINREYHQYSRHESDRMMSVRECGASKIFSWWILNLRFYMYTSNNDALFHVIESNIHKMYVLAKPFTET